jgi:hypothetical protein
MCECDRHMAGNSRHRESYLQIAERSVAPRKAVRYGDDMRTLTAGSLSASLAVVAIYSLVISLLGITDDWTFLEYYGVRRMPFKAALVATAGSILGAAGLWAGWKSGRRISITSAFGMTSCYLTIVVSLIIVVYNEIMQWR